MHLNKNDKVALMTYSRNTNKLYNLVNVQKNNTQLRNQIKNLHLKTYNDLEATQMSLKSALNDIQNDLEDYSDMEQKSKSKSI
jgi:hypothetical protein